MGSAARAALTRRQSGHDLRFLDTLERFVDRHGRFDPATRAARFGDLVAILEEARSFYRAVAERADL